MIHFHTYMIHVIHEKKNKIEYISIQNIISCSLRINEIVLYFFHVFFYILRVNDEFECMDTA